MDEAATDEGSGLALLGLHFCGSSFEFADDFPEMRILAQILQIVVGHQAIGIFISTI